MEQVLAPLADIPFLLHPSGNHSSYTRIPRPVRDESGDYPLTLSWQDFYFCNIPLTYSPCKR
jgi:hypothetical protein